MSRPRVGIFVATMTGMAEMCAEEVEAALLSAGLLAEHRLMDNLDLAAFSSFDFIVIISSTYGHGDIPDNGQAFYSAIEAAKSLSGTHYAVFGLGDRTYMDTFCQAGRRWDALLAEKGASRFAPLMEHDASSGTFAEDIAGAWAAEWADQLKAAA